MAKISSKSDLPKWFSLENYKALNSLSDHELLTQIYYRAKILIILNDECFDQNKILNEKSVERESVIWQQIKSGLPLISLGMVECASETRSNFDWRAKFNLSENKETSIQGSPAITGLRASKAIAIANKIKKLGVMIKRPLWGEIECYPDGFSHADINILGKEVDDFFRTKLAHISINLDDFNDKEIIYQLEQLLPKWREELKADEPKGSLLAKKITYSKILKYNVIPFFDLYVWGQLAGKSIPHRVYTVALFPNGEKGETEFKQTIMPFVYKVFTESCRGRADCW